jgi:hypothetical protein
VIKRKALHIRKNNLLKRKLKWMKMRKRKKKTKKKKASELQTRKSK